MARVRQTEIAVLGALSVQPMTGYAVREAISDVLGHFWSESFGQIYPTLSDLEKRELIVRHDAARPGSSLFAITPAGRQHLLEQLRQPYHSSPPRNGMLLRIFFGHILGTDACRDLLRQAEADARTRLAELAAARKAIAAEAAAGSDPADPAHRPYWLLTISAGEHAARATLAWARESLAELDTIDEAGQSSAEST